MRLPRPIAAAAPAAALAALAAAVLTLGAGPASAADVISNPSFETDPSAWSYSSSYQNLPIRCTTNAAGCTSSGSTALTGSGFLLFGAAGVQDGVGASQTQSATQQFNLPSAVSPTLTFGVRVGKYGAGETANLAVLVDGIPAAGFTSPTTVGGYTKYTVTLPATTAGTHLLQVRYIDSNLATEAVMNVDDVQLSTTPPVATPTPTPTTPAAAAPDTVLGKKPARTIKKSSAKITFSSPVAGTTFTCKVDKKKAKACTSPFKVKNLKPGKHKVKITATAGGRTDTTPSVVKFTYKRP